MNEGGDIERVEAGKPTIVPAALQQGIGLYGFTTPQADSLVPLEPRWRKIHSPERLSRTLGATAGRALRQPARRAA